MHITKVIFSLTLILNICASCHENDDTAYSNGKIQTTEDSIKNTKKVTLKILPLDGANLGWLSIHDSLMSFMNPKLPDRSYNIFDIDTGKEIDTFCYRGSGPGEVAVLDPISHLFKEKGDLKTLLFAPNEEKLFIWNITQSIKRDTTVMDKQIPYPWGEESGGAPYYLTFLKDENTLVTELRSFPFNDKEATLPVYQKRILDTNKLLKSFSSYKKPIRNDGVFILPESFFYSNDAIKPDRTKVVQAMTHPVQLNILNFETGHMSGCRLEGEPDFSVSKNDRKIKSYFIRVQVDDNYIYAVYWGKECWERSETPHMNIIHVHDWDGNLVQKIETDYSIGQVWIDPIRNRLHVTNLQIDDVFYLDLDDFLVPNTGL